MEMQRISILLKRYIPPLKSSQSIGIYHAPVQMDNSCSLNQHQLRSVVPSSDIILLFSDTSNKKKGCLGYIGDNILSRL